VRGAGVGGVTSGRQPGPTWSQLLDGLEERLRRLEALVRRPVGADLPAGADLDQLPALPAPTRPPTQAERLRALALVEATARAEQRARRRRTELMRILRFELAAAEHPFG
jgi:hypothetical protein